MKFKKLTTLASTLAFASMMGTTIASAVEVTTPNTQVVAPQQTQELPILGNDIQSDGTLDLPNYVDDPSLRISPVKTRNQAVEWANKQIGKYIDYDHVYGAQCVDLIQAYAHYAIGKNLPSLNAIGYTSVKLPSGWTRIKNSSKFIPKPGDIAIWSGNAYGHVGIITKATLKNCSTVEQNAGGGVPNSAGHNSKGNQTRAFNRHGYYAGPGLTFWGVLRPTSLK